MSRLVKVDHVVLTLKASPAGAGMTKEQVDDLVNKRLGEGYTDIDVFYLKTNIGERGDPTDFVFGYIFKQYEDAPVSKSKKSDG